jgi:hypothetical protein
MRIICFEIMIGSTPSSGEARNKVRNNRITCGYYAVTMPLRLAS